MKRQIFLAILLAALALVGVCAYLALSGSSTPDEDASNGAFQNGLHFGAQDAKHNSSAPYRDGLYLGKLDARQGMDGHISSGRWGEVKDREMFAEGYRRAYLDQMAALVQRPPQMLSAP